MGEFAYRDAAQTCANAYLWPALQRVIERRHWKSKRAFDLGCGNGATLGYLARLGFEAVGVDISESGIVQANAAYPHVRAEIGSAYDDLASRYGTFPLVVSLEVIEHCMDPRTFAKSFLALIEPGGIGFLSTPYHGYWKNLALAVTGKLDSHFTALWDGGHIKFFSVFTLRQLLNEAGAADLSFTRVGRIPTFAKSMAVVIAR